MGKFAFFGCAAIGGVGAVFLACSSSDGANVAGGPVLATESHTFCVHPQAAAQDVTLPATGGVTGTLSFGAFATADPSGCDVVRIATGDAVEGSTTGTTSSPLRIRANGAVHKPLITISVGEGLDGHSIFGDEAIISGMQLQLPPELNFPDGTYYMTLTSTDTEGKPRVQVLALTATSGMLEVASQTDPLSNTSFPVVVLANTSAILSIYARGVTPTDNDIAATIDAGTSDAATQPPTIDISDAGLPPLDPNEPDHAPPTQGFFGYPPPNQGAKIGYVRAAWSPGCSGNPGCNGQQEIVSNGGEPAALNVPLNMVGNITWEANIAYMQLRDASWECPADWDVSVGMDGTGHIYIPPGDPFLKDCTITYSTLMPGQSGGYYTMSFKLVGHDIGNH